MELTAIVRKALLSQSILIDFDEHVGIPADKQPLLGVRDGMQVRVSRVGHADILLTVRTIIGGEVRMGYGARQKIGGGAEFTVKLTEVVARSHLSNEGAGASADLVERFFFGGNFALVMAPHGGDNEAGTNEQAERLVSRLHARGVSYWATLGFDTPEYPRPVNAHERWHITSADMSDDSFPFLKVAMSRAPYRFAVAFHGHAESFILVGGRAPETLRAQIAASLRKAVPNVEVRLAATDTPNGGMARTNMVNRATLNAAGSIQIECPRDVRLERANDVADAIADVMLKW